MTRIVRANLALSLDGRYNGPGGSGDLAAVVPYATTDVARDLLTSIWQGATTVVLSRGNAEGFLHYWSRVAADDRADPRDRGYARWLMGVEKVVFSRTWSTPPWEQTTVIAGAPEQHIAALARSGEGDILVNTSPVITKSLLAADLIDQLFLEITPEITGAGDRLFDDGIPATRWNLASHRAGERGELALVYHRLRGSDDGAR